MRQTSLQLNDKTRNRIAALAKFWGYDGQRVTTPIIEAAITQALRFEQITAAGGSFSEAVAPYRHDIIVNILTQYLRDCVPQGEERDSLARAIVSDIASRLGVPRIEADAIAETPMVGLRNGR